MSRSLLVAAVLCMAAVVSRPANAACPSYTLSSTNNNNSCGVEAVNGTNPTVAGWQPLFQTVSKGPVGWGANGPLASNLGDGCGKPQPLQSIPARFPCELLQAIAMQESGWRQFCVPTSPADQVGGASRTIISFDCGYGVGQITSGMHIGESPAYDRLRVAAEPLYNLATGARILADKWKATECVGDNQTELIEHWYSATWAYNGLSYKNNPNSPNYDPNRGVWNPSVGGAYTYQERVWGWMQHPPSASHWKTLKVAYPDLLDVGNLSAPPALPDPNCASPTDCTLTRPLHVSACFPESDAGMAGPDAGAPDAGAPDAGAEDAGAVDAGTMDAGEVDAGAADAGGGGEAPEPPIDADPPGGCGCGAASAAPPLLLMITALAVRRRRRVIER